MLTGVQDFRFGSQSIPGSVPTECHPWSILSKSEDWKHKHGAQFEPSKYMLIHFTRNTRHDVSAAIQLNHVTISPTGEACYLGVIFDQKLKFHAHLAHATKKGTKFALALSSIARITWGYPL